MLRRFGLVLLAVLLVAALSLPFGCGDDESDETSTTVAGAGGTEPTATEDTATETTAGASDTTAADGADEGSAIFAAQCAGCHGASGEGGGTGPALQTRTDLDQESVEEQVREGGDGMPAFEGQLTDAEIIAVSQYVTDEIIQR
jgi:mono/diheme cytochrome c family protein